MQDSSPGLGLLPSGALSLPHSEALSLLGTWNHYGLFGLCGASSLYSQYGEWLGFWREAVGGGVADAGSRQPLALPFPDP